MDFHIHIYYDQSTVNVLKYEKAETALGEQFKNEDYATQKPQQKRKRNLITE